MHEMTDFEEQESVLFSVRYRALISAVFAALQYLTIYFLKSLCLYLFDAKIQNCLILTNRMGCWVLAFDGWRARLRRIRDVVGGLTGLKVSGFRFQG